MERIAYCLDGTAVVLDDEDLIVTSFSSMEIAKEEYPEAKVIDDAIYSYEFSGFMNQESIIDALIKAMEILGKQNDGCLIIAQIITNLNELKK